jgi:hypothetical protein
MKKYETINGCKYRFTKKWDPFTHNNSSSMLWEALCTILDWAPKHIIYLNFTPYTCNDMIVLNYQSPYLIRIKVS